MDGIQRKSNAECLEIVNPSSPTSLKILHVIHQYPPHSSQGSEVYCRTLAEHQSRSCDVSVFHVSGVKKAWRRRLNQSRDGSIRIWHCVDLGHYQRSANVANRFLQTSFQQALAECRPDVVHFHNYISLGDALVTLAKQAGARVVYTLHDYGLICPNNLLLTSERTLCSKADGDFFGPCCPDGIRVLPAQLSVAGRLPALDRWRNLSKQHPWAPVRALLAASVQFASRLLGANSANTQQWKKQFFRDATAQIFRDIDLFLAPSEFLRDRFVACGVTPEKIRYLAYGIRHFPAAPKRPRTGKLRIGYIGALQAHKGVELIFSAFQGLQEQAELHIHGSTFGYPIAECYWRRVSQSGGDGVFLHGAYRNEQLPEILASLDVVIVPSIWYENAPLTIQEAQHAGVPVVTSNVGGMAEMIKSEQNGLTFEVGNSNSLQRALRRLVDEADLLTRLQAGIQKVPSIEEQTLEVLNCYRELCGLEMLGTA